MGKKGGTSSSWLTAVKRAFRSPTKDSPEKLRNCRRKEDHHHLSSQDLDDEKKKEKRRWLFKKGTGATVVVQKDPHEKNGDDVAVNDIADHRHAIAVAVATAAAAEAAVATAHAAMEVARLARPAGPTTTTSISNVIHKQHFAAVVIQTSFRGYLPNIVSNPGSAPGDTTSILESRYLQDIAERRSLSHSREASSIADDWDDRPHKIEEVKAMLQSRKQAAFKREKSLSQAFSQQMWRNDRNPIGEEVMEERPKWLDRWMASKQWDSTTTNSPSIRARASVDHHRDSIKTVEMDTSQPYSYLNSNIRRSSVSSSSNYQPHYHTQRPASPVHSRLATPSPARTRSIQVRSASPRCVREYTSNMSQTPSLRSNYYYHRGSMPNYMAATESARARVRSQSAPRQRGSTPERDRPSTGGGGSGPKKRLSFPNPEPSLRSPSFKSVMEQQSNYSSCCTDSIGGEISPSSTSDLRRWLR